MAATWADMSGYVVHFTKDYGGRTAYDNMLSILGSRRIEAVNTFGAARKTAPVLETQKAACFSEVPFGELERISANRSPLGIGFAKAFAISEGANPIWYLEKDSRGASHFQELMQRAKGDPADSIWQLAPLVDFPGEYGTSSYRFEWEREWRKRGHFGFAVDDVCFLILPEDLHESARGFFDDAEIDNVGPNYRCPFIDAKWNREKISRSIARTISSGL